MLSKRKSSPNAGRSKSTVPAESVGERIKQIRIALKLTQAQFIVPLRISPSHFSETESGKNPPSGLLLVAITHCYNVNMRFLEEGVGEMFKKNSPLGDKFTSQEGIVPYYEGTFSKNEAPDSYVCVPGASSDQCVVKVDTAGGIAAKGDNLLLSPIKASEIKAQMVLFLKDRFNRQYVYKVLDVDGDLFLDLADSNLDAIKFQKSRYTDIFKVVAIYRCIAMD